MCTNSEQYNRWLNSVYYQEEVDMWTQEMRDVTNKELLERPAEERPVDWLNPWVLSQDDIDKMRQDFKGGYKKWSAFVSKHIPFLDPKIEAKLKRNSNNLEDVKRCGKPMTWIDKKGLPHTGTYLCKHYDICPICQKMKENEHKDRLRELRDEQYVVDQKKEMVAKYGKQNTYSFTTASGHEITVVKTEDKIDGAEKVCPQTIKTLSEIVVTGHRTSGLAGKEDSPSKKENVETRTIMVESVFVADEDKDAIEKIYYQKTKNFQPISLDDYVDVLKRCNSIFLAAIKKVSGEIHFLGKKIHTISENDLDWSERNTIVEEKLKRLESVVLA